MKLRNMFSLLALLMLFSFAASAQTTTIPVVDESDQVEDQAVELQTVTADGTITMTFPSVTAMHDVFEAMPGIHAEADAVLYNEPPVASPAYAFSAVDDEPEPAEDSGGGFLDFFNLHSVAIAAAVMAVIDLIVAIIPTSRDWTGFKWLRALIFWIVPNYSKAGGRFPRIPKPSA